MEEKMERVTTTQAAKELNINVETLHYMMQSEKLPIGYCFKKPKKKRYGYYIYRGLLDEYKKTITG